MLQLNENQVFQYNESSITFQKGDKTFVILSINIRDTDVYNISDPNFLNISPPSFHAGWSKTNGKPREKFF